MAQNANTSALYTTVKNISGKARVFGYLGERGMRLAAGESVTVRGSLVAKLGAMTSSRRFKALEKSLDTHQSLEIVSTPAVILYDAVSERSRQLSLQGDALGVVDPSWASSGSSDFVEG